MGTSVIDRKVNSSSSHELAFITTEYTTAVMILITRSNIRKQQTVLAKCLSFKSDIYSRYSGLLINKICGTCWTRQTIKCVSTF